MRRRLALAALCATALGSLAVTAEGARTPAAAPTIAYRAVRALPSGTQPVNKAIAYHGAPLRFAGTTTPRGMGEPTVGVTKRGTAYVTTIEFDGPGGATGTTVIDASHDGGRTFKPVNMGVQGTPKNPNTLDPYVYVDTDYGRAFNVDLEGAGSLISWVDDSGEARGDGFASAAGANDHQTLVTAVPPKGNPLLIPTDPSFPKIVYYCVNTVARIACSHSLDGGRTYIESGTSPSKAASTTGGIICGSLHGHIVTDRDGRLFLPRDECDTMELGVSEDGGLTWTNRTVTTAFPGMKADSASVAVDKSGNLYYVWYDALRALPYLSVSKNHGVTWSAPVMIAPPGVTEAWFPEVTAGDDGKIAVWFMGSSSTAKEDPHNTRPWNIYAAVSTDALSANPTFVSTFTNRPGDPIHRGDCSGRCGTVFDFLDIISAPNDSGRLWGVAVDSCTRICSTQEVPGNSDESGSYGKSDDNVGQVFRQVSGPALKSRKPITSDTRR